MDSETALTTPTTAFVTDWTRLAWRLSPAIQSIRRPARLTVITFRFMPDYDDLHFAELPAFNEGISQGIAISSTTLRAPAFGHFSIWLGRAEGGDALDTGSGSCEGADSEQAVAGAARPRRRWPALGS